MRSGDAAEQAWYSKGLDLYGGVENLAAAGTTESMSQWLESPSFVPRMVVAKASPTLTAIASETTTTTAVERWWEAGDPLAVPAGYVLESTEVAWEMASTLIFRVPFPGSRGYLSVIGRVTLELGAVREAGRLVDDNGLGETGVVLLLDIRGHILGATGPGAQAVFVSGELRPRKVWQFDAPWARYTEEYFSDGSTPHFTREGYFVAIETLPGKALDVFKILVAAERGPFKDAFLLYLGEIASYVLVCVPIPGCILIIFIYSLVLRWREWRALKRVVPFGPTVSNANHRTGVGSAGQPRASDLRASELQLRSSVAQAPPSLALTNS